MLRKGVMSPHLQTESVLQGSFQWAQALRSSSGVSARTQRQENKCPFPRRKNGGTITQPHKDGMITMAFRALPHQAEKSHALPSPALASEPKISLRQVSMQQYLRNEKLPPRFPSMPTSPHHLEKRKQRPETLRICPRSQHTA